VHEGELVTNLTQWRHMTTDKLQAAGYVSGYSPLFPTAILGRFLMTRVKAISREEVCVWWVGGCGFEWVGGWVGGWWVFVCVCVCVCVL